MSREAISDLFLSVVVPLHDDADILEACVSDTLVVLAEHYLNFELVLIDDGSTDRTFEVATGLLQRFPGIRLIRLSRSFGQEIAIAAGLDTVIGDYAAVMLPDDDPPQLIPAMVGRSRDGAGVVFGVRTSRAREPWWLRAGAAAFYTLCDRVLGMALPRHSTHFRVMSRQAINAIVKIKDPTRYLRTLSAYVGYGAQSFKYEPITRRATKRRKTPLQAVRLALDIVVSNTTRPLQLAAYGGLALSGLYLLFIGYTLLVYAFRSTVAEGWTTLSAQSAVAFFFLFLMLTVLSEYLGSLLEQTRERPLYFVVDERNSQAVIPDQQRRNVVSRAVLEDDTHGGS